MPSDPQIYIVNAATTVAGNTAAQVVSPSPDLARKTAVGVIDHEGKWKILSLYRLSSKAPGRYSRDVYRLAKEKWKLSYKDRRKYSEPPLPPPGAFKKAIGSAEVWTMEPLTEVDIEELMGLLSRSR